MLCEGSHSVCITIPRELLCCLVHLFFPKFSCRQLKEVDRVRDLCEWKERERCAAVTGFLALLCTDSQESMGSGTATAQGQETEWGREPERDPSYRHHSKQQPKTSIVLRSTSSGSCVCDVALWHRLLTYNRSQSVCVCGHYRQPSHLWPGKRTRLDGERENAWWVENQWFDVAGVRSVVLLCFVWNLKVIHAYLSNLLVSVWDGSLLILRFDSLISWVVWHVLNTISSSVRLLDPTHLWPSSLPACSAGRLSWWLPTWNSTQLPWGRPRCPAVPSPGAHLQPPAYQEKDLLHWGFLPGL